MIDRITALFRRRQAAEVALQDPVLNEAFNASLNRAVVVFLTSAPDDVKAREAAHAKVVALGAVRNELAQFINDHKVEQARLDKAEKGNPSVI